MPGFNNNVVYAGNLDFSGSATVTPQVTADGQLLIGSTAAPNIKVGTLSSADGSIGITNGSGTISLGGKVVQQVRNSTNATTSCNVVIPLDDTIPQNTEGVEVITLSITPKSNTNILVFEFSCFGTANIQGNVATAALFQDATADALYATAQALPNSGSLSFSYSMLAGTTSATTFKIRIGSQFVANPFTLNWWNGGRVYGGVGLAEFIITEYAP